MQAASWLYPGSRCTSIHRTISSVSSSISAHRACGTLSRPQLKKAHATHSLMLPLRSCDTCDMGQRSRLRCRRRNQPLTSACFNARTSASSKSCSSTARLWSVTAAGTRSCWLSMPPAALRLSCQSRRSSSTPDSSSRECNSCWRSSRLVAGVNCLELPCTDSRGMLALSVRWGSASLPPTWIILIVSSARLSASMGFPGGSRGALAARC
mmetsp:Transcript_27117/g.85835  ORF Transcript_27117/g.85835 Transcript_27117/m.85835 type:complete len:210 (+) Transcript_27117:935-1564(+)